MKKSLLAVAVLASVSGVATAATSVTLYGIVDVGYQYQSERNSSGAYKSGATQALATTVANDSISFTDADLTNINSITTPSSATFTGANPSSVKKSGKVFQRDGYHDDSRLGVKGQEDLGNGMAAIFKAEMRFAADTGSLSTQLEESYVGLKGSFGEVTVGRRLTITDDIFGYASNAKELSGTGLGTVFNNSLSYRGNFGGLTVGADVTTGENTIGYTTSNAGANIGYKTVGGRAYQYAAGAEYSFGPGAVGLGYEHTAEGKHAYALGLKYKTGPVTLFGRVARTTQSVDKFDLTAGANMDKSIRATGFAVGANYQITSNDVLGVSYSQLNKKVKETQHAAYVRTTSYDTTALTEKSRQLSLDYTHSLSKRTSIYAGVNVMRVKTSATGLTYTAGVVTAADVVPSFTSKRVSAYTIGLKHAF